MNRLAPIEKWMLLLALFFFVTGIITVFRPQPMVLVHPSEHNFRAGPISMGEYMPKNLVRVYGGVAIVIGTGLAAIILFLPRNR